MYKDRQKSYFLCLLLNPQSNIHPLLGNINCFYIEFLLLPPPLPLSPFPSPSLFLAEVLALVLAGRCFGAPLEAFLQVVFPAVVMVDALRAHNTVKQTVSFCQFFYNRTMVLQTSLIKSKYIILAICQDFSFLKTKNQFCFAVHLCIFNPLDSTKPTQTRNYNTTVK